MKILWLSFSLITAEPWHASLPQAQIVFYDRLPNPIDRSMLDIASNACADIILFCGIAAWERMPSLETLCRLRSIAPTVFLSGDLSDPPWHPYLNTFRKRGCFNAYVNFDGNDNWPHSAPDFTALTPMSPSFFANQKPLKDRLIPFGFCGGCGSPSRREIIDYLVEHAGLQIKPREEQYGTYARYANFMKECQLTVNVPHSGSDNSEQVKGRVLEAGLAGTCLLEHEASAARHWFDAGTDYIVYRTKEEAAMIARGLLENVTLMQETALRLQRKVIENHSPEKFWARVFEAVGAR